MIRSMSVILCVAILVSVQTMPTTAFAESLGPVSEEYPPAACDPGSYVSSVKCTGKYCDNMKITCFDLPNATIGRAQWMPWISEEGGGMRQCPANHYIAGFACRGKYCDNVSLYCVELKNVEPSRCEFTRFVSEEGGGYLSFFLGDTAGQHFAAKGMHCTGSYCDNKQFEVCELRQR
ncbi:MAG: hypothetical protein NBKEAIPA_03280 [Nitrospirae bacterium]|nr:MAG: hypothetical protein UZ03_NOB001003135 [Nitrospira sp. OLB3]MBV6471348.1 hypothetical protein [Nitrospirota bacterium]MCE7966557.1 hypothetical protein [Nitrospira sp. NTP2]RIK60874.1 MAG: hypothetical protein DCC63_01575 [Nitrospira sp.]